MCQKFVLVSNLEKVEIKFGEKLNQDSVPIHESYAVSRGDNSYVITSESPKELQVFKFGMTPYWAKSSMDIINARAEGDKDKDDDPNYEGPNSILSVHL